MKLLAGLVSFLVVAIVVGVTLSTVAQWPLNYADSDDLTLASYTGGLAHPPGYPLLTQVLHPILTRASGPKVAIVANGANALVHLVGLFLLVGLSTKVLAGLSKRQRLQLSNLELVGIAVLGVALWASSEMVFAHGRVLEVFAWSYAFLAGWAWWGWSLRERSQQGSVFLWEWFAWGILGAVNVFHHQLTLPLVVGGMVVVTRKVSEVSKVAKVLEVAKVAKVSKAPKVSMVSLGFLVGLVGSLFVYRRFFNSSVPYSWQIEPTILGIVTFFSRLVLMAGGSEVERYVKDVNWWHSLQSVWLWVQISWRHFGWLLSLIVGGFVSCWYQARKLFWWLFAGTLVYGPLLVAYFKFPLPSMAVSETEFIWGTLLRERMLFVVEWLWVGSLVLGVWWLYSRAPWRWLFWLVGLAAVCLSWWQVRQSMAVNQDQIMRNYAVSVLESVPSQGVLIVDSDLAFSLLYQQLVDERRSDVTIVPVTTLMRGDWFDSQQGQLYAYRFVERNQQAAEVVRFNLLQSRRVFLYDPGSELLNAVGVEGDPFYAFPSGSLLEVSLRPYTDGQTNLVEADEVVQLKDLEVGWLAGLRAQVGQQLVTQTYYWSRLGYDGQARAQAEVARQLLRQPVGLVALEEALRKGREKYSEVGSYTGYQVLTADGYLAKAIEARLEGDQAEVWYFLTRSLLVEPENEKAALLLQEVYREIEKAD